MRLLVYLTILITPYLSCDSQDKQPSNKANSADVIIYGGTSAAITAAVQTVKMGKSVIVVSPDIHLGGLSSSGLGFTDTGDKSVIGGLSREFYQKVYNYYDKDENWKWQTQESYGNVGQGTPAIDGKNKTMWIFEPHIAESIFEDFLKDYDITVHRDSYLNRENGVKMKDGKINSITTLNGTVYQGKIFIDATYEGDLMAAAGVNYHVGRESNKIYNEEWNGIQVGILHHKHNFGDRKISPYKIPNDASSGILPKISGDDPGERGNGDKKLQAYCFRMCLTNNPENRKPFDKPDNYDPQQYELLARVYESGWNQTFRKFDAIPNLKTDTNNHGPFSTDNIGMNYDYPEASYERRREIIKEHEDYQKGLMYFIATDSRIPADVQSEFNTWGLAKDEFEDNNNWPHQIYVREARRMVGNYVMTEHEILGKTPVEKSIGMGSYTMDSHNVQRYITPEGHVQNEGDIGIKPKKPYQIHLGTILPKKEECSNLIVPVAVSSSHIAYGSIRMEPVFMILGQSAATVAVLALENNSTVQDVSYTEIAKQLKKDGQVLISPSKE
ncbi:hypothetical protein HME9304_00658 [Flagellimonas maritima]|uniref:FAD-dependent oxidoreductase n=1 Tax=Flagellimonas maritima TaxID=1383885 RepID=A0A2Z4LQZ2_9FLAO|nr:FAD-dependent oxidoreductase [Allomuricauda aurantiaca]AWX43667.1 hypothetical protein HME9304_00658 [Allomuricauda aurantiaca]